MRHAGGIRVAAANVKTARLLRETGREKNAEAAPFLTKGAYGGGVSVCVCVCVCVCKNRAETAGFSLSVPHARPSAPERENFPHPHVHPAP
jgi:hypothetical protein